MRALIDTSVWSLALARRTPNHPAVDALRELMLEDRVEILLTPVILQEVLQAFRSDESFERAERHFRAFELLSMERGHCIEAARLHRQCASHGLAVSTADCAIAVAANVARCTLWTTDRDFVRIAEIAPDLALEFFESP